MTFHSKNVTPATHAGAHIVATGGVYGWLTPAIEKIASCNAELATRQLRLPRSELHFIALCLSLMGEKARDPDHLAAFARGYNIISRRHLIDHFGGRGKDSAALVKLCGKLAGAPWRAPTYLRLASLLEDSIARKTLRHLPVISRRQVLTLKRLPPAFRTIKVLNMIRRPGDLAEMAYAIEVVRKIRHDLDDRQIGASFENAKARSIHGWMMKHYEQVPFPPAPTDALIRGGVEVLRPLSCFDDLARTAREFENCIRTYLYSVLMGDAYFYRYAPQAGGQGVAVVELRRTPVAGWVVYEALGPKNEAITGADRASLIAAFRSVGVSATPQAINPSGPWIDLN